MVRRKSGISVCDQCVSVLQFKKSFSFVELTISSLRCAHNGKTKDLIAHDSLQPIALECPDASRDFCPVNV